MQKFQRTKILMTIALVGLLPEIAFSKKNNQFKKNKGSRGDVPIILFEKNRETTPRKIPQEKIEKSRFKGVPLIRIEAVKENNNKFKSVKLSERTVEISENQWFNGWLKTSDKFDPLDQLIR